MLLVRDAHWEMNGLSLGGLDDMCDPTDGVEIMEDFAIKCPSGSNLKLTSEDGHAKVSQWRSTEIETMRK